jgi:LCP family protein required for cell wall assembly
MFEHLDDPVPFQPDERFRAAVRAHGRRRRLRRRLGTGFASSAAVVVVAVAVAGGWSRAQLDRVERVEVDQSVLGETDGSAAPATILVVGRDDSGKPARTDAMILVRLDPGAGAVRVVSVPRDLWVDAPTGAVRLNTVLSDDGATALVETVERTLEVTIDHYAEVDFEGIVALVDLVGGIDLAVERPLRDERTGIELDAGCQHLDGASALALLRSRAPLFFDGSRWVPDTTSDLGRMARQQAVAQLVPELLSELDGSPLGLVPFVDAVADHVALDQTISTVKLLEWGRWARGLDRDAVVTGTVPTRPHRTPDGAAVLLPDDPEGQVQRFLAGALPGLPTGEAGAGSIVEPIVVDAGC